MNKKVFNTLLIFSFVLILEGCTSNITPALKGFYQSEPTDGYVVQLSFQSDDNSFVEYISNVKVNNGTFEEVNKGVYNLKGDLQDFDIILDNDNSFEIIIKKLNDGTPIKLANIDEIPMYFSTAFDDVNEYISLLE